VATYDDELLEPGNALLVHKQLKHHVERVDEGEKHILSLSIW
jgi:hypothetical protein